MMNQPVEDPIRSAQAFELYLQNQSVVYAAVWRTKLIKAKDEPLFDELVEEGMWLYRDFYLKRSQPVETPAEIEQFNAMVLQQITWRLLRYAKAERQHRQTGNEVLNDPVLGVETQTTDTTPVWEIEATAGALYATLNRKERQVFDLLYGEGLTIAEVRDRTRWHMSQVYQIRKQIQAKYLALQAEDNR
ncbi:sigma-70 RNA polymerase sigma factor region 4 domain-containing protein [Lacticaseibacillus nasuensis]|uniref:hypothetical protein n=1 Tax=Lacticaseibacillus nasuensis TaxID=944671 RepID=UPI0022483163|nr:hypothetical protein [Lacticaseibacillus nasuensis]MCX2454620.1 hypothetical protein [Lacticaseibacillus nasuensis]